MKKTILIFILINYFNSTAKDEYTKNKGYFGIGILGPFPNAIQLNLAKNIEIEFGFYNGLKNLFQNFHTLFTSIEFNIFSSNSFNKPKPINTSLGIGIYGLWWISKWQKTHEIYNSTNIGIKISLSLILPILKRHFDLFLKVGPGINIWGIGNDYPKHKWEVFAGLGIKLWVA
ncbi:Hypothetical protein BCD_0560 [Borrelia crocidurae DOU]|uniref:Uncharacterized protein n=1 Tax=Borrelia crocidurae DOU TaxID=1293575 RepID=W5SNE3_9SPIR|nr:DUF3996 domain-containing protein [Borrelia crocidurae]AHH06626.1 Hypothetical protein BCD_0560 [Borrelia crocidurae DOU]